MNDQTLYLVIKDKQVDYYYTLTTPVKVFVDQSLAESFRAEMQAKCASGVKFHVKPVELAGMALPSLS